MTFAYFMNTYPMTSSTFIRREINAHERAGLTVDRFAIRPWDTALVDPLDIAEQARVTYLLDAGFARLLGAFIIEAVANPRGMARAFAATVHLIRKARRAHWKPFAYLVEAVTLKRLTTTRNVKHIHTHFSTNSAAVAMLSFLLGGPSYSVTVHGPDELFVIDENALTLKLQHAAFFVAITNYCRQVLLDQIPNAPPDKLIVVPCGLDMSDYCDRTPIPGTLALVCVGRLCKAKAQTLLVEALAQVVARFPDVHLTLIGDGDTRPAIERAIATHGLEGNVTLVGWRTNEEVREALLGVRALVLPSLAEGLPIVIMESFALERPVLSTTINGIPELVDDSCGWLVAPGDVEELAEGLCAVLSLDQETLNTMGRVGRSRVEAHHDQDINAARLRDLIRLRTSLAPASVSATPIS